MSLSLSFRNGLIFTIGLVFFFVAGFFFVIQSSLFADYLKQWLIEKSAEQQIALSLRDFKTYYLGASADTATVFFPRIFTQVDLQQPNLRLAGIFNYNIDATAKAYKGELSFKAQSRSDQQVEVQAKITALAPATHPALNYYLGIKNGSLDLDLPSLWMRQGVPETFQLELTVNNLLLGPRTLTQRLTGLPLALDIPEIQNGEIHALCKLARGSYACPEVKINSSLVVAKGVLETLTLGQGGLIQASLEIEFKDSFKSLFGTAVSVGCAQGNLICKILPKAEHSHFEFSIDGSSKLPRFTLLSSS